LIQEKVRLARQFHLSSHSPKCLMEADASLSL
jgi:hypothetical protein